MRWLLTGMGVLLLSGCKPTRNVVDKIEYIVDTTVVVIAKDGTSCRVGFGKRVVTLGDSIVCYWGSR